MKEGSKIKLTYFWSKFFKKIRGSAISNSYVHKTSKVEAGSNVVNTSFDKYSFCGYECTLVNCDVGAFTSIADHVSIGDFRHPMEWVSMSPVFYAGRDSVKKKFSTHSVPGNSARTRIGNDVWIGKYVLIKSGVTVGDGAVIGMGSIVTKDVGPYSIVVGSPASEIRKRFDEVTIEKLLQIKWWNFSDERLSKYAHLITNPADFIDKVEK
ncbi:CatB-related O-acetyltransferase [Paenibacillus sp. TRM 82003]|nr:CatB-related O-acetyltransferase [Paenibacillus sp. TRM 82003]